MLPASGIQYIETDHELRLTAQVGSNGISLASSAPMTGEKSSSEGSLNGSRQWQSI